MQPAPNEITKGIVRILRETVGPAVTDDHARTQLAQVITVLGGLDWDDAGFALARPDEGLTALLAECASWIAADETRRHDFEGLPLDAPAPAPPTTFAEANANWRAGRAVLHDVVRRLRQFRLDHGPGSSDELLDHIGAYLAAPPA